MAGIVTLSSGDEIELLGMVAPAYRRRGIGRTLLAAARQECVQRDVTQFLLVVEEASPAGVAFAEVMSGRYQFSEHLMELDPALTQQSAPKSAKPEGRLIVKEVGQAA